MPYCTNCRERIEPTWRYCGECGTAIPDQLKDDGAPQSAGRDGFLSPQSVAYLRELWASDQDIDYESPDHVRLCRETRAAFRDFARMGAIDEIHIIRLGLTHYDAELDEGELTMLGITTILKLYDRSLGTDFLDEFSSELIDQTKEVYEEIDGLSWPPGDLNCE